MKTALLIVSFGTTHPDTLKECIVKTEECISAAFPSYPMYRAFTSRIVRSRLESRYGIVVDDVETALAKIAADGFTHVLVQPTLLIPGEENDRLLASLRAAANGLQLAVGAPLLSDDRDLDRIIDILQKVYPTDRDTVLLLMGHGTEHRGNEVYRRLIQKMKARTDVTMRLCTVDSSPSFTEIVGELTELGCKRVRLAPLLFVAGDHAKNDMSGDDPESLRSRLTAAGISTECILQGLGQHPEVRQLYIQKALDASRQL